MAGSVQQPGKFLIEPHLAEAWKQRMRTGPGRLLSENLDSGGSFALPAVLAGGTHRIVVRSVGMSDKAELYDEATKVSAKDGEVILDGPDGVDVKLTPEAAQETSDNLMEGAATAAGQRKMKDFPHQSR